MLHSIFRLPFWAGTMILTATGLLLVASIGRTQVAPPPPGPPTPEAVADEPGMETLTQGPIHEAFANPADMDPTPVPVVPAEPPQPIAEEPPEYMPEGAVWIPGYWLWDDDRDEFIWITGVARIPPPNMQWVPGYFAEADGGWQRVSGFWASIEEPEVEYRLTGPPETLETGPSSPSPSEEHFWVPGYWNYYDTGYRWHAGYWAPYVENWIWVPARWVWTPGGYVFCQGFWDHRLAYRGQMFAPVYFQQPIYTRPAFVYRPWCVIPTNNLFIHLWIRPRWNCYYFGNYYGPQFAQRGFVPWANLTVVHRDRYFYDPFYSYARVHYHRQGIDYIGRVQGWHRYFVQHEDLRPPRTWRQQQQFLARDEVRVETQLVARTVVDVARRQDTAVRVVRLDEQSFRNQRQHAERLREFNQQRRQLEVSSRQAVARGGDDKRGDDKRGDDRDRPGRDGKAGSLVDRAEGKAGRDERAPGRGGSAPRLTIPRDLVASTPTVGRERNDGDRTGEDNRGKAGKGAAGGPQKSAPPPRPRPTGTAADGKAGKGKAGNADRQPKGVTKAADRQETPPSLNDRDRGAADLVERDATPGRGKAGNGRPTARDTLPGGGNGVAEDADRGGKAARDAAGSVRTPDASPAISRGKGADRDDDNRSSAAKGKAGGQTGRGDSTSVLPGVGDAPRRPGVPSVDAPNRNSLSPRRDDDGPSRPSGTTFGPRPDAGVSRPAGTITPGIVNPDRLGIPGTTPGIDRTTSGRDHGSEGANRGGLGSDRGTQGLDRSDRSGSRAATPDQNRSTQSLDRGPSRGGSPFNAQPGAGRGDIPRPNPPTATPGRGGDAGRGSPFAPRSNAPNARPDNDNRGKGNARPERTEAFRPDVSRETAAAPMPRVQPRVESRPMPRVEPQRESRPMPRIETARESRPAPRSETSRPSPRSETSRSAASSDRGPRGSSAGRSEPGPPSSDSNRGGKGKGRDRDN